MNETQMDYAWSSRPRVRLYGQPIGLGILLAVPGGYLAWNMALAYNMTEPLWLQLSTIALFLGFGLMFLAGVAQLLTPFEKVWISRQEVQLRLGSIVLRRIPVENIRSLNATTREVIVRNRDCNLYRIKINCEGKWPHNRTLWIDWSTATEEALRKHLTNTMFLL